MESVGAIQVSVSGMHQHFNECASSVRIGTGPQLSRVSSVGNTAQWATPRRLARWLTSSTLSTRSDPDRLPMGTTIISI